MEQIAISVFKAKCLAILDRVQKTRKPVLITKFGQPIAEIMPPPPSVSPEHWMGSMQNTGILVGDLINPATEGSDWDALKG